MTNIKPIPMKYICPLIVVSDIQRSRNFYENVLNQKVSEDYGENLVFEGGFSIHLEAHYKGLIMQKPINKGGNNVELFFISDALDELQERLKGLGVEWIHEIRTEPWGQRVLRFYDPDAYIIEVGEPM